MPAGPTWPDRGRSRGPRSSRARAARRSARRCRRSSTRGDAGDARGAPLAVTLPPPVDLLHRIGLDADAENELHEREAAVSASAQGRSTEALCDAYGQLGRAKRRYQVAQQIPAALLAVAPTPKTRWSWDCAFPTPYAEEVTARAKENDLPRAHLRRHAPGERLRPRRRLRRARSASSSSSPRPRARSPRSRDRATTPAERASLDDDTRLTSPPVNIALGARYLKDLLAHFHGVLPLAIAAYNAGPDAVTRWLSRPKGLDLDLFVERIPYAETRTYVARVMGNLARYGYLRSSDAGVPALQLTLD